MEIKTIEELGQWIDDNIHEESRTEIFDALYDAFKESSKLILCKID